MRQRGDYHKTLVCMLYIYYFTYSYHYLLNALDRPSRSPTGPESCLINCWRTSTPLRSSTLTASLPRDSTSDTMDTGQSMLFFFQLTFDRVIFLTNADQMVEPVPPPKTKYKKNEVDYFWTFLCPRRLSDISPMVVRNACFDDFAEVQRLFWYIVAAVCCCHRPRRRWVSVVTYCQSRWSFGAGNCAVGRRWFESCFCVFCPPPLHCVCQQQPMGCNWTKKCLEYGRFTTYARSI